MKHHVKIIGIGSILIVISFFFGGFFFITIINQNNDFQYRQQCAEYLPAIENDFKERSFFTAEGWSDYRVLRMFYSTSRKSCLYIWHTVIAMSGTRISYVLTDALSNEILEKTDTLSVEHPDFAIEKQKFFDKVLQYE